MPFKMKGSPLKAIGETKDGIIKRALTGQKANIETSSQRQSKGLYTKDELAAKSSNKDLSDKFTASLSKPGNKANNPFVNGVDTSVAKPTPQSNKTAPRQKKVAGNAFEKAASKLGVTNLQKQKVSLENKGGVGTEIKTASASKLSSDLTKKTAAKSTKTIKSSEAPKSRKELRLAKTKKKAADVKSDYNAGSRGQAEGRAAKAKHNRLNKRAERIEDRIAKKNKK